MPTNHLKSLPSDRLAHINGLLAGATSAVEVAKVVQSWGYFTADKLESLERKIRRYRQSEIAIPAAARARAIASSPNPRVQKRVMDKAEKYSIEANWFRLVQAQEKRVDKWLSSGAGSLPSSVILNDIKALTDMYAKFTDAMMERGILPRAAKTLNVRADQIVIDDENVHLVCRALQEYMATNPQVDFAGVIRGTVENAEVLQATRDIRRILADDGEFTPIAPQLAHLPAGQSA